MLRIYGDAEVTVSEVSANVAPAEEGAALSGAVCTLQTATVELGFSATTNCPLYPVAVTPEIRNGLSTCNPSTADVVVTVILVVAVPESPAYILEIPTDSPV